MKQQAINTGIESVAVDPLPFQLKTSREIFPNQYSSSLHGQTFTEESKRSKQNCTEFLSVLSLDQTMYFYFL